MKPGAIPTSIQAESRVNALDWISTLADLMNVYSSFGPDNGDFKGLEFDDENFLFIISIDTAATSRMKCFLSF